MTKSKRRRLAEERASLAATPNEVRRALGTTSDAAGGTLVEPQRNEPAVDKEERGNDAQAIFVPKGDVFPKLSDAKIWILNHAFDESKVNETLDKPGWLFVQFPADELVEGSARWEELANGCRAWTGQRKIEDALPNPKSEGKAMDATTQAPEAPVTDPAEQEEEVQEELSLSAQCLTELVEHLEAMAPKIEQPQVKAAYEKWLGEAKALGHEVHPDHFDEPEAKEEKPGDERTVEDVAGKNGKGKKKKSSPTMNPEAPSTEDHPAQPDADEEKGMLPGHKMLKALKDVHDEHMPMQEAPGMKKLGKSLRKACHKAAQEEYPKEVEKLGWGKAIKDYKDEATTSELESELDEDEEEAKEEERDAEEEKAAAAIQQNLDATNERLNRIFGAPRV
jgi:hypothetical protein